MADEEGIPPQPKWDGPLDEEGRPHGQGTMTYPPPPPKEDKEDEGDEEKPVDVFTGTMVHGVRQGKGKYTWASGAVFEGEYVEGSKQCEQGTMIYLDKGRYEGSWEADKPHGQGTYTYPSGDTYAGGWVAGRKHGVGTYHFQQQQCQYIGTWAEGQFAEGQWVQCDGSIFKGQFAASLPAQGTHFFSRAGLVQSGCYQQPGGKWQGGGEPVVGQAEMVL